MKRSPFIILLLHLSACYLAGLHAQTAMGGWRTHFAYNSVTQIVQTENKVYAVSNGALFSVDKLDNNVEIYSKITGLNGSVVSAIKYDAVNRQLIIGYDNGNIDLMTSGGIINIPDFYNKIMTVNKSINHINIYNNKAYLSCHFGIIVLNLQRREIAETYYIGPNATEVDVISTTVHENHIYALAFTPVGAQEGSNPDTQKPYREYKLYKANVNNPNLVNYENWDRTMALPAVTTPDHQALVSFAGKLFIQSNWSLYMYDNGAWSRFSGIPTAMSAGISVSNGRLIMSDRQANVYSIDESLQTRHYPNIVQHAAASEYDPLTDTYWFAAEAMGIVSYQVTSQARNELKPNGPYVNIPWDITFAGEKMFVVPGGRWSERENRFGHLMIYEKGAWTNILPENIYPNNPEWVRDFMNVAVDPTDDTHFFVTSYGTGLYEFKNNVFDRRYLSDVFEDASGKNPAYYTRLDGAVFDAQGNLFVANSGVSVAIKALVNGNWIRMSYPPINNDPTLGKIVINQKHPNQKWISGVRTGTIFVFDDNGTIDNLKDDRSKAMKTLRDSDEGGKNIIPTEVYCIAQDLDGVMWVGTNDGPLLFNNTENVFESDYTCSRVKIPRNDDSGNNQADYLLAEEHVKAIAIDGANRKWLGTKTSGVYLMSANGQETIHHFTTDNSPLLSNEILSIAINPVSGEVFIGTGAGLVSYQSDAAAGNHTFENVYAYPNPVRENFNGVITITGLVKNTQVKITDLNGNLICQTVSNGGIATWDGKDAFGRKVSTGIYLAMCITEDGKDSAIAKIMVIN